MLNLFIYEQYANIFTNDGQTSKRPQIQNRNGRMGLCCEFPGVKIVNIHYIFFKQKWDTTSSKLPKPKSVRVRGYIVIRSLVELPFLNVQTIY